MWFSSEDGGWAVAHTSLELRGQYGLEIELYELVIRA